MILRNLTPHELRVVDSTEVTVLALPPCARPPRLAQHAWGEAATGPPGVVIREIRYGPPSDLPDPEPDVLLVVSRVVAREVDRRDLVFPDGEVRDADGRIVGCRGLAKFAR